MNTAFYPRLALDSVRKNARMYIPWWITCQLCVCIFYLLHSLTQNPAIREMQGGGSTVFILNLGCAVIGVFSIIFLLYTQIFLIRRRKREFGLYSVLGLSRASVARIVLWETWITAAVSLTVGLLAGILLSKLGELLLTQIIGETVRTGFFVSVPSVWITVVLFCAVFLLLLMNSIRQIRFTSPVDLLRSEHTGEKPPKGNIVLAILGLLLLGVAYWMAVTIQEPLTALILFFIAVILVIIATYLLMISGSVTLCRLLQKHKPYYYQTNHFVSVSSMMFRMKRNGAGLASVCILATMVLVMLSSTSCLFFGAEDSLRSRFPREFDAELSFNTFDNMDEITNCYRNLFIACAREQDITPTDPVDYRCASVTGLLNGNKAILDPDDTQGNLFQYDKVVTFAFVDVNEVNRFASEPFTVPEGSLLVSSPRFPVQEGSLWLGENEYRVFPAPETFEPRISSEANTFPTIYLITDDLPGTVLPLFGVTDRSGAPVLKMIWEYGFDTGVPLNALNTMLQDILSRVPNVTAGFVKDATLSTVLITTRDAEREDYFGSFGGFFFLGILLSLVFMAATAVIIYYKQLSEGYEDQSRFTVMQKVGMTHEEIRKSVSSQMCTIFLFPLGLAVIHLCFAFPLIRKLLMLFGLNNLPLLLAAAAAAVALFAGFYLLVWRYTAGVYYRLVISEPKNP